MVFNKFNHLARPSRTLTHGYAQSLAAATQSTAPQFPLAKHHANQSGRPSTAQQHTPFSTLQSSSVTSSKVAYQPAENAHHQDGGLKAYYDAWHKLHQFGGDSQEWNQFQFPRLIESKPQHKAQERLGTDDTNNAARTETETGTLPDRENLDRARSASAVDDVKKGQKREEAAAIAQVDAAIATVIEQIKQVSTTKDLDHEPLPSAHDTKIFQSPGNVVDASTSSPSISAKAERESARSTPLSDVTAASSAPSDPESQVYLQKLEILRHAQSYQDIPPAFESMLSHGIKPTTDAYNALLSSAIHLPLGRHQLVPKALNIYSDMLRRGVSPNEETYSQLIQVLSRRALHVAQVKVELMESQSRYRDPAGEATFLLASDAAEYAIMAEDDALKNAIGLFTTAITKQIGIVFSTETYQLIIHACAKYGNVQGMVCAYQHLETQKVKPISTIFPAMISAFAKSGDLESAMECYNEYRSLAIADDAGEFAVIGRNDGEVYSALVRAYAMCGHSEGGRRFFDKVIASFASCSEERQLQSEQIQDQINLEGILQERLECNDFSAAWAIANSNLSSSASVRKALSRLCIAAADASNDEMATQAYGRLSSMVTPSSDVATAMLALHIRQHDLEAASKQWKMLISSASLDPSLLEPTASFTYALVQHGQSEYAMVQAREIFSRIRAATAATTPTEVSDQIDEIIVVLARAFTQSEKGISTSASMNMLGAMVENGGLISAVTEQVLTVLRPEQVASLSLRDGLLALQVQAAFIGDATAETDLAHASRLDHLVELATKSGTTLDQRTMNLVDKATEKLTSRRADIIQKWNGYKRSLSKPVQMPPKPLMSPTVQSIAPGTDNYDPYAANTDYRGSTIIIDELENHRNAQGLKEALTRFRNIRRAGRHPRYIVYAKLIGSAAKEGRTNLTHDILGMARSDVPFLPEYPVVRHGWSAILDAMIGACLTAGKRILAEQYHQELLETGSAPSANTYGLYITTLKASTKTFDEATEAVKIFHRAVSEGVVASSFLYNALIGKLGKARRIDDCLRYFQEMRAAGVRPTSVTYGTIVNALCRVSDERFAEELFDEMESMPNYKPRPAPYNSLMQYFLTTKRDSQKVLAYYTRMRSMNIEPTMHTYKLLIDTYATLEPINLSAADGIIDNIRAQGLRPEAVHYASLIHAKGCVLHDMKGARKTFDEAIASKEFPPQACLYQALFESMVANHRVADTEEILDSMSSQGVEMTPYIANTLIHGWATENQIAKSKAIYDIVGPEKREPSTYESMTRAFLTAEDRKGALAIVHEMLSRGYPSAVSNKILELVGRGVNRSTNVLGPNVIA